ncbi:hypothetical protein [Flavobacterium sp.]|uniref:hypothetical protein n=1 Tax=Flavobacterium sp. TaxID=239 RepID=UPI0040472373
MKKLSILALGLFFLSCSSDDSNSTQEENSNLVAFFKTTLGTQAIDYKQNDTDTPSHFNQPDSGYSLDGSDYSYYYGSGIAPHLSGTSTPPTLDITMHHMLQTTNNQSDDANFANSFNTKPTNFITSSQDANWVKGVSVSYTDENNNLYTTLKGDQAGSAISYSSSVASTNLFGRKTQIVTGTVSCKLYKDNDPSVTLTLTNGSFKLVFQEFND